MSLGIRQFGSTAPSFLACPGRVLSPNLTEWPGPITICSAGMANGPPIFLFFFGAWPGRVISPNLTECWVPLTFAPPARRMGHLFLLLVLGQVG